MMKKPQILLSVFGIILIAGLYQLPRVVVENDAEAAVETVESHDFEVSASDAQAISSLKQLIATSEKEKSGNFADSLAKYFLKYGMFDSARQVTEVMLERDSSLNTKEKAVEILYRIFERAGSGEEASLQAVQLRPLIESLLEAKPDDLSLKNKLAMTLVTTEAPMSGIMVLREIVATDPTNREALINLGLLSIQSGQFDRAVGRFENLVALDSSDFESKLYLGISYLETGREDNAKQLFTEVANAESADPAVRQASREYLSRN